MQPVFDAIVESAVRLCDARHGTVFSFDGDHVRLVAHHNFSETWLEAIRQQPSMPALLMSYGDRADETAARVPHYVLNGHRVGTHAMARHPPGGGGRR